MPREIPNSKLTINYNPIGNISNGNNTNAAEPIQKRYNTPVSESPIPTPFAFNK